MLVVRDIQESQNGIACVTCIAWHHLHGLHSPLQAGMRRRTDGGRRIERACTRVALAFPKPGRLLEDRMEARIGGVEGGFLGSVALETLCDATIALRTIPFPFLVVADPTCPRRLTLTQTQQ